MTTKAPVTTADTYVRARIDTATKDRATDALDAMGLSISDKRPSIFSRRMAS